MGRIEINFKNQALQSDDIPPKVHYCWRPIFVELGNKQQPASPLNLSALSKTSVRFDPQTLSAPSMHTFLIYNGMRNDTVSKISTDPSFINRTLYDSIHGKVCRDGPCEKEGNVDSVYAKIDFINWYIKNEIVPHRNFIINVRTPSKSDNMSLGEMELDRNMIGIILPELEDLISEIKLSHRTPRGFIQRPIGLGGSGKKRLSNMSTVSGYKGIYVHIDNPELILQMRHQKIAMMGAYCQVLHMLPNFTLRTLGELDLIKTAFIIDSMLAMGIDITSIHDIIQILPLWNKWRMTPSIFGIKTRQDLCIWFLQMYVLGRYLSMIKASGIDSLIRETSWEFTGNNLPTDNILTNCFNGLYRGEVSGLRQYWAWPSSSADMRAGYLQIMAHDPTKRNFWYLTPEPNEFKIRSSPVFVEYEYIIMPDLLDEGYDAAVLCLEPSAKMAERRELYHKEAYPPTTLIQGRYMQSECVSVELLETILTGGQPLYGGNLLYRPFNDQYEPWAPVEGTVGRIPELEEVMHDRDQIIGESGKLEKDARRISNVMYRGDQADIVKDAEMVEYKIDPVNKELNPKYLSEEFFCPQCEQKFASERALRAHYQFSGKHKKTGGV